MLRTFQDGSFRVSLDLSNATYRLDCEPAYEPTWLARTPQHSLTSPWLPAAVLAHKAKVVSDGVLAAVELLMQRGTETFPGKSEVLLKIAKGLLRKSARPTPDALVLLATALRAGGTEVELGKYDVQLQGPLEKAREAVRQIQPLSFYTWSEGLQRVFRQDRWLQQPLDADSAAAIASVLERDAKLLDAYQRLLRFTERLTAPFDAPTVLDGGNGARLVPPSRSAETNLIRSLYGNKAIPEGWKLIDELIARLRDGSIDFAPRSNAGWYEYEQHALSALLDPEHAPEASRVQFSDDYRAYLTDLFKALLALTRETHAKQLPEVIAGGVGPREHPLYVEPELTVEPLVEHYLRRATSLELVRALLRDTLGDDVLEKTRGLREAGHAETDLLTELTHLIALFRGAAGTSARELGWDGFSATQADLDTFQRWRLRGDPDLLADTRMMLPLFFDERRRMMKVWCVLGYETRRVSIAFDRPPEVLGVEVVTAIPPPRPAKGRQREEQLPPPSLQPPQVQFVEQRATVSVPVMEEVYVRQVMTRAEFRAFCDRSSTREELLRHLRVAG